MRRLLFWCAGVLLLTAVTARVRGEGVMEYVRGWSATPAQPSLADVARMIDHLQESLGNQGSVVIKQPDVWSQARMTKFRKEYENTMAAQLTKFQTVLSARIARSDSASFSSQTALAGALSPLAPGQTTQVTSAGLATELSGAQGMLGTNSPVPLPGNSGAPAAVTQNFSLLNAMAPTANITGTNVSSPLAFGLEPNVQNDQQGDYITHLQRLRRINLGDDNADSAGYGLYLMRVPVSITPGDKTKKGFGAIVNLTVRHDFGPRFLPETYRNLVINDLVDQLSPIVYELIRSGLANRFQTALLEYETSNSPSGAAGTPGKTGADHALSAMDGKSVQEMGTRALNASKNQGLKTDLLRTVTKVTAAHALSRSDGKLNPVAPSDVTQVFGGTLNMLNLAYATQEALDLVTVPAQENKPAPPPVDTNKIHMPDVRSYLNQELSAAYDLMASRVNDAPEPILADAGYIQGINDKVRSRAFEGPKGAKAGSVEEFSAFVPMYDTLIDRLPGNLHDRPIGVLCWAIAVDAGLLNHQLHEDMSQVRGADGWVAPPGVEQMAFYVPDPQADVVQVFQDYIKARWPMITFSLEPVIDEQNVDDAFTRRRDLQLAVAFALSAGRISFRQAINFTRQLQYESQTIALNQTVSAFAHGNDTFGWRISPRYQTPPEESNFRAVTNMLLRGGPGANYQIAQSKIEPGLRELTAVVVMPSFVRGVRIDVANDWYRLVDPDERKVHTARAVELGRKINEASDCLAAACACGRYRPEDVERLRVRLHQLEQLLPLQTQFVRVPYENTLGGSLLFTQGASALVPELTGFEGIDYIDPAAGADVIVYGKHFNIYETHVTVGGKDIPSEGTGTIIAKDANGNAISVVNNLSPLRDASGNLLLLTAANTTVAVADNGSFDIVSREVMRVRIPKNVAKVTRADGSEWVELYVSTPNGISNKVQIPVKPTTTDSATPPPTFTLGAASKPVTLAYNYKRVIVQPSTTTLTVDGPYAGKLAPETFDISPKTPLPTNAGPVDVKFDFDSKTGVSLTAMTVPGVKYDLKKKVYTIPVSDLANPFVESAKVLFDPANPNATVTVTTSSITISASAPDQASAKTSPLAAKISPPATGVTDNQLTINIKFFAGAVPVPDSTTKPVTTPAPAANPADAPVPAPPAPNTPGAQGGAPRPSELAPLPQPALRLDAETRKTMFQAPSIPVPAPVESAIPPRVTPASNFTDLSLLPPQATALVQSFATPGGSAPPVVIVPPRSPNINIQVPINNMPAPPKARHSLFHRKNATPQNPTRPPFFERLFGNP